MALRQASRRLLAQQQAARGLLLDKSAAAAGARVGVTAASSSVLLLRPLAAASFHASGLARDPAAPEPVPLAKLKDSFNDATSVTYLEELEQRYRRDPRSVDTTWASFFRSLEGGVPGEAIAEAFDAFEKNPSAAGASPLAMAAASRQTIQESMRLVMLVRAYQVNGHFAATLDPLGLEARPAHEELKPESFGFGPADLDREFFLGTWAGVAGFLSEERPVRTLREILTRLRETYSGNIGYEYMHIPDRDRCNWLRERIETPEPVPFTRQEKLHTLDRLAWSDMFETFLANKYTAAKRFGLEGCETLIPGMKSLIDRATELGVQNVVLGMPHRGRLNVLANVVRKPMDQIFSEFSGRPGRAASGEYTGSGDVKYHLGTSYNRPTASGHMVHLSLMANPSHLEAVDTIVLGKCRAKQHFEDDHERSANMPILLHGDGAFSGQGIVYECLDMSGLPDYTVGGCIHLVVNNQVAFTTDPKKSRSSPYCTDVAKALNAPIFHVNADDVESVVRVCTLAAEWRQRWKGDVVVDLVCYRKHGHNEIDEPMFTQPLMYRRIRAHKNAHQQYVERLLSEGSVDAAVVRETHDRVQAKLAEAFEASRDYKPRAKDWLASHWEGFMSPAQMSRIRNTGVKHDLLVSVGHAITALPETLTPHRQIKKVYEARRQMIDSGEGVDWATAEALAFATLLVEGNHVRLSGQDVERGTFSHRHAVLHDQVTGATYVPLKHVYDGQPAGQFAVSNSSLSEFGVLGFELGYSMESPNSLVLWEAQFGDFANSAQIIFDQFLSSGEAKWLRQSGLVCLLPHGYDGQGPEHSSCRLERFLQMSDENPYALPPVEESTFLSGAHLGTQVQAANWQVVNVTTPANYFHVLRRQVHRQFRKPLIVAAPKSLLRHPKCRSPLAEFDDVPDDHGIVGVRFKRVIMDDSGLAPKSRAFTPPQEPEYKRIVFCSGKVFYELHAERERRRAAAEEAGDESAKAAAAAAAEVAIVRVEQLAPFPFDLVRRELRRYPNAELLWAQEEPMNMGAYFHVQPRFISCMRAEGRIGGGGEGGGASGGESGGGGAGALAGEGRIKYAGRAPAASTATGFGEVHAQEQARLVSDALDLAFDGKTAV